MAGPAYSDDDRFRPVLVGGHEVVGRQIPLDDARNQELAARGEKIVQYYELDAQVARVAPHALPLAAATVTLENGPHADENPPNHAGEDENWTSKDCNIAELTALRRRQRPRSANILGWVQQSRSLGAAADLDYAVTLLRAVQARELGSLVRIYRPEPTVSFGQRDARLPGFSAAQKISRELGFEPVIRKAGGRAAAYHRGTLVVDHLEANDDAKIETQARFVGFANLFVEAFQSLGVDAAVGEIPGEYCPGEFSVHGISTDGARIKLVGTAQRVVKGAWLFSSSIVVEDSSPLHRVTSEIYQALDLDLDPTTVGAAQDLNAQVTTALVAKAIEGAYRRRASLEVTDFEQLIARVPPVRRKAEE